MTPLEHALAYVALGWAVLPLHTLKAGACTCGKADCTSPGKHPLTDLVPHGVHDATRDEKRVAEWFGRVPGANVGIATGEPSGVVALDVDPRNGGDDLLADLERKHGKLPETALQLTGGGGYHYLFQYAPGMRLRSPGRGIDVKSTGGYIVAEPSSHVSGGHYAWEGSADPTDGHPIAATPAWMIAPAANPATPSTQGFGYLDPQRQADLRGALGHLDASDYTTWINVGQALHSTEAPEAYQLWDTWSQTAPNYDPQLHRKWDGFNAGRGLHVESIFVWARDAGWDGRAESVAVVASYIPKPVPVPGATPSHLLQLPGPLGTFVDLANRSAPKPQPQFAVQAALALGCAVLGRRYKTTRENWPSLYFVNIGKSASGKEHARTVIDAVLTAAQLGHLIGPGGYTSDGAVFSALLHAPAHLAIIDELGALLGNARAQGNFHKRQAIDSLTQAWGLLHGSFRPPSYSTMTANQQQKKDSAERVVHRPALSMLGMTTPRTFYSALTEQAIEGGFLNRLLIVESHIGRTLSKQAEPIDIPDSLVEWCRAARTAQQGNLTGIDLAADQIPVPRVVDLLPEARAAFRAYEQECIDAMDALDTESLAELQGRSVEKALRIALVLAVADNVATPFIRAEHADWAIDYVRHYTTQTIEAVRRHLHDSQFGEWCQCVLETINAGGEKGVTERELAKNNRTFRGMEPRLRGSVLNALAENGQACKVTSGARTGRGGKARVAWVAGHEEETVDA